MSPAPVSVEIRPAREDDRRALAEQFAAVAEERDGIATEPPIDIEARAASWTLEGTFVAVAAGELVFGSLTSSSGLGPITAGSSQGRTFTMRSTSSNIAEADILSGSAGAQDAKADLIIANANIVTLDAKMPRAQAIAIAGDKIIGIGARRDLEPLRAPSTRLIE